MTIMKYVLLFVLIFFGGLLLIKILAKPLTNLFERHSKFKYVIFVFIISVPTLVTVWVMRD